VPDILAHITQAAAPLGAAAVAIYALYYAFGVYVASKDPNALQHLGAMHPRAHLRSLKPGTQHAPPEDNDAQISP
jgi:hypothetical protein